MANVFYGSDNRLLDVNKLGADIVLTKGDLAKNNRSDLLLIDGIENVIEALKRVLTTPYGSIAKFSYTNVGIAAHDENYGFSGWSLLAEPLTSQWMDKMKEFIRIAILSQPRINLVSIESTIVSTAPVKVVFDINFKIQNSVNNIAIVVTNQGIVVVQ